MLLHGHTAAKGSQYRLGMKNIMKLVVNALKDTMCLSCETILKFQAPVKFDGHNMNQEVLCKMVETRVN